MSANTPREPEPARVYDLGHFEAMQISLALGFVMDTIGQVSSADLPPDFELLEVDYIRQLAPMFQNGVVTVINRENP